AMILTPYYTDPDSRFFQESCPVFPTKGVCTNGKGQEKAPGDGAHQHRKRRAKNPPAVGQGPEAVPQDPSERATANLLFGRGTAGPGGACTDPCDIAIAGEQSNRPEHDKRSFRQVMDDYLANAKARPRQKQKRKRSGQYTNTDPLIK